MQLRRKVVLFATAALAAGAWGAMGLAAEKPKQAKEDIWEDEARQPRWYRGLSDETIDRIMKGLRKRDPARARELARLRKKDPERFKVELREHGRPELEQIGREYWEARRRKRNAEFLEWLKANYPAEHEKLTSLKDRDPNLYVRSFEHVMNEYGHIFDAYRFNPELGAVLKDDFALKNRREELRRLIRTERSEAKRQALGAELQDVVAQRYDLIVRRMEIAYGQLLKKLEDLQKQVRESRDGIAQYKDERFRRENVRQRVKALTENKVKFRWD
jgi:hypothetical protein